MANNKETPMSSRLLLLLVASLAIAGCPIDRIYSPRLQNSLDDPVHVRIAAANGDVTEGLVEPGQGLVFGDPPEDIVSVTFSIRGSVFMEIDSQTLVRMAACSDDPKGVTWSIEFDRLTPSKPCGDALSSAAHSPPLS